MKKIILSGYMGSGKTTLARLLQSETGMKMIDLDEVIEENQQKSIAEIFAEDGEIHFRKIERAVLEAILNSEDNFILSLGGGTPCYSGNDKLLKDADAIWIYLRASPETLLERLIVDSRNRPLIAGKNRDEMREYIAKNLFDRSYYYNQADHKIDTDGKSLRETISEIKRILI